MPEGTLNALADHRAIPPTMRTQNGSRGQRLIVGVNLITSGIAITMVALAGRVVERAIR
jgi:hypothetical protein